MLFFLIIYAIFHSHREDISRINHKHTHDVEKNEPRNFFFFEMCRTYQEGTFYISYLRFSTRILNEMCKKNFFKNQNMTEKIHKNFMMMTFVKKEILLLDFYIFFSCDFCSRKFDFVLLILEQMSMRNSSSRNFCFSSQNIFTKHLLLNRFYAQLFWNFAYGIGLLLFKFCLIMLEMAISFFMGYGVQMG